MCVLLYIRDDVVVVFAFWYDNQWIFEISLSGGFLGEPYFVEGLAGDAAREVGVKLEAHVRWDSSKPIELRQRGTIKPQSLAEL